MFAESNVRLCRAGGDGREKSLGARRIWSNACHARIGESAVEERYSTEWQERWGLV